MAKRRFGVRLTTTGVACFLLWCGLWLAGCDPRHVSATVASAAPDVDLEVFSREGCPHCAAAQRFLATLQQERPGLRLVVYDVQHDPVALTRLQDLARQHGVQTLGVPAFYLHGTLLIGYRSADTTGVQLKALLDRPPASLQHPQATGQEAAGAGPEAPVRPEAGQRDLETVDLPFVGRVHVRELGFPLVTIVLGLLDGVNPCAMWVLLFVLSLLVHLHSRTKMALIGGTFVVVSGLVYLAFMAAWLQVFLLIGWSRLTQMVLGGVAVLIGVLNVKDGLALGGGISLAIPAVAKPGLYARVRRILQADNLLGALTSVVVLAVLVNMVELLCTAGLPAVYTQLLAQQQLPWWGYYGYLVLYNVAYMLDDSLMLLLAIFTLGRQKLHERQGRWLKLLSGVVMLGLGLLLLVWPTWLLDRG